MAFKAYKTMLEEFISIQSVSTDEAYRSEIDRAVTFLVDLFAQHDFTTEVVRSGQTNPVVVARLDIGAPQTVLVYGHYDVQPAAAEQNWAGEPFKLAERNGRLYGRGVADNKGQTLIHMATVFELAKRGQLRRNVVFVLEGNEETSNPDLPGILEANPGLFACDIVLISDGKIVGDNPTLDASLRGGFNLRVAVVTAKTDLHSGLAGGAAPSASYELIRLLGSLYNDDGTIAVKGFYDEAESVPSKVLQANTKLAASQEIAQTLGVRQLKMVNRVDFYTQTGLYPTLQISGMKSGYTGPGFASIVPGAAEARLNIRIVANQNPQTILDLVKKHIEEHLPSYVEAEFEAASLHDPVKIDLENPEAQAIRKLLAETYGCQPVIRYVGGAIPIITDFQRLLGVPIVLASLANDDCNMHGADENFQIALIEKGLQFSHHFFGSAQ